MKTLDDYKNGEVILIDKPLHWTSFQVVNKIRWEIKNHFQLKKIKVGHAGTLDPLATGLLILCTGKMTKKIEEYQAQVKEYTGTISLGSTTPSFDLETDVNAHFPTDHITESMINHTAISFLGQIDQKPPIFSAIKKDGKRLYELARAGETTSIKSRKVYIESFEIISFDNNEVNFRIKCSKGTYIRSIAHDFGIALNSGSHLSSLRRTKIGNYSVDDAKSIEQFLDSLGVNKQN